MHSTVPVLVLVVLTSAGVWLLGIRTLGLDSRSLAEASWGLVETVGLAAAFLALNLVLGFALVRLVAGVDPAVSVYVLEDVTLVVLSLCQGVLLRGWLGRVRVNGGSGATSGPGRGDAR